MKKITFLELFIIPLWLTAQIGVTTFTRTFAYIKISTKIKILNTQHYE